MIDLFGIYDIRLDDSRKSVQDTTLLHNDQKLQGFFSNIGMTSGDYLHFQIPDNLVIVGDIHGDLVSLQKILNEFNWGTNFSICRVTTILQENIALYLYNHPKISECFLPTQDMFPN